MSKINTVKEIAVKVSDTGTENDYVKKPIGTDAENVDRVNGETVEESLTRIENTHGTYDTYGSVKLLSPNTPPPGISDVTGLALSAGEKDKTAEGTLAHELFSLNLKYEDPYLKLLDKDGNELSRVSIISVNHQHGYTEEITREANCTETGLKTFTCACGESYTQEIPVNGIHNFVDGVCTRCGKEYDPTETAPAETEAHSNWNYTLNEANKTITLNRYIGNEEDVIVYGNYVIDGVNYKTKFNDTAKLFYYGGSNPNNTIRTIKFSHEIDTSNVTNMSNMFNYCQSLVSLDVSCFDTSNVTNMSDMFNYCRSITSLDLSNLNTSNVTNMSGMFNYCISLASLDISNFDTSNVTDMSYMFSCCTHLTSLDVNNFNTSKVNTMENMFDSCSSLTSLDISNFDTSNVTDMIFMFSSCESLTSLDISNFDTSNVTNMNCMFFACISLTSLNLSNFNTSKVTSIAQMFYNCAALTSLDLSSFNTSNVTDMKTLFEECTNLITIYVSREKWVTSQANTKNMFRNCGTSEVTYK